MFNIKRKAKDSLFTNFFSQKENTLKLYKVLHPEDMNVNEDDIQIITIENIIVNDIYNDLGFMLKDKLFILVEAQSTWNGNMAIRSMMYLGETYRRYIHQKNLDLLSSTPIKIPEPELYVIYTGSRLHKPDYMSITENFFTNTKSSLEVKVKMIYNGEKDDVVYQYISFCRILDEQRKKFSDDPQTAIEETIRICKDKNIMEDYITTHENEVYESVSDMLYRIHIEHLQQDAIEKGMKEGIRKGIEQGIKTGIEQGIEKGIEQGIEKGIEKGKMESARQIAINMLKMNMTIKQVSEATGLSVETIDLLK